MKINYAVLLMNKEGIAYDVVLNNKHYNFTMKQGSLVEAVEIGKDGGFQNISTEKIHNLYHTIISSKLLS